MPTTAIQRLKPHPAQMRTAYDLDALAALTLQLHTRGLDDWQPIVASPNGDGFHIISGHRRHMAQLLAFALADWAAEHPDTAVSLEVVRTMLTTLLESLGSLPRVIDALLGKYGAREIPFVSLFVWAHVEWRRARGGAFSLPVNGHGMQFVTVQERPFPIDSHAAP